MRLCDKRSGIEAAPARRVLLQRQLERDQESYEEARAKGTRQLRDMARRYREWGNERTDPDSRQVYYGLADESLRRAHDPLPQRRKRLQQQERDLSSWWNDRAVLIRPSRTQPVTRYHVGSACGQVTKSNADTERFEWILEGEA